MIRLGSHPLNLAVRFILEMAMSVSYGVFGYSYIGGSFRILWAILFPIAAMTVWAVIATRHDPSRSGKTVIQTPGILRLMLEISLFVGAVWVLIGLGYEHYAIALGLTTVLHYLLSIDRIQWL